jgi:hypothetical protein
MDMVCVRCGEPWDNDTFHEAAEEQGKTYRDIIRDFQSRGCIAIGWQTRPCERDDEQPRDAAFGLTPSEAASALYDLLGDDTDGAMAMLDDMF